jgi:hypothetical protein
LGGGRGGGRSQVKRARFLGRLSIFLCGNSIILCVSIFPLFFSNFAFCDDTMNLQRWIEKLQQARDSKNRPDLESNKLTTNFCCFCFRENENDWKCGNPNLEADLEARPEALEANSDRWCASNYG